MNDPLRRSALPRLRAALAAASCGWPVFPLFPGSKRPAITGWQHQASTDPDVLATWWRHRPYNIGLACGPAGLLVVDLDSPHQTEPEEPAVSALLDGEVSTYTVATPRGQHRYYSVEAPALGHNTVGRLAAGVDTRGAGGFVLAAGSIRQVDGGVRRYRVISRPGIEPQPVPQWLLHALDAGGHRHVRTPAPIVTGQHDAYTRAAIAGELARVRGAVPGTRNAALFTAAVHLGQLAAAGLLNEHDVTELVTAASSGHVGVDGFTAAEANRAIGNGLRYGRRRPRAVAPVQTTGRAVSRQR